MKCYKITPSPNPRYDDFIVPAGESWQSVIETAADSLETQHLYMEEDGRKWTDIKVSIECIEMDEKDFEDLLKE